ncbi:hypothetical protein [Thermococcus sp.]
MRRDACLLLLIAALLVVSLAIPSYTYSPPVAGFVDSTIRAYEEPVKWVGYVECTADTTSYYHHVVNWTLSYPHDYGVSDLGIFKTTILVDNWSKFLGEMPVECNVLERNEVYYNEEFWKASERLKNLTVGTSDYEKLKPFFSFTGSPKKPANVTRVQVTVFSPGMRKPVKKPFILIWSAIIVLGVAGVLVSYKDSKVLLVVFLVTILLGAIFIGKYIQTERKIAGTATAFNMLLSMNSTGKPCTEIGGAQGDFSSSEDVEWFLKTLRNYNASVNSIRWEDLVLRVRVGVDENNYRAILERFKKRGWETSEIDVENFTLPPEEIEEINETFGILKKYLPNLTADERKAVEEYMAGIRETIHKATERRNLCVAVFATNSEAIIPDYGDYSNFLAKLGLIVVVVGLISGRRRNES